MLEAMGKDDPRLDAQKKRFNTFLDKAAAKEDAQELEREKKKVKTEDQPGDKDKPDTPENVEMQTEASSIGLRRRPLGEDEAQRDVRTRVPESRGEKRTDEQNDGRESRQVRFKVPDKQGENRVVEDAASGDAKVKKI